MAKERSNGYGRFILGYALVSKALGSYIIHRSHNVKLNYFSEVLCHLADFDRTPRASQAIHA